MFNMHPDCICSLLQLRYHQTSATFDRHLDGAEVRFKLSHEALKFESLDKSRRMLLREIHLSSHCFEK